MAQTINAKPGDLIEIFRLTYKHWAVYIGKDEVVHLVTEVGGSSGSSANPGSSNGMVKREKLTDVVGSDRCQVNNLLDNSRKPCDPFDIVKKACEMVGPKQYNLDTYNCEHFATEMRYSVAESLQVRLCKAFIMVSVTHAVVALIGVVALVVVGAYALNTVFSS